MLTDRLPAPAPDPPLPFPFDRSPPAPPSVVIGPTVTSPAAFAFRVTVPPTPPSPAARPFMAVVSSPPAPPLVVIEVTVIAPPAESETFPPWYPSVAAELPLAFTPIAPVVSIAGAPIGPDEVI